MKKAPQNRPFQALIRKGIMRSRDLQGVGVSRTGIRRLTQRGVLEQVGHGLIAVHRSSFLSGRIGPMPPNAPREG